MIKVPCNYKSTSEPKQVLLKLETCFETCNVLPSQLVTSITPMQGSGEPMVGESTAEKTSLVGEKSSPERSWYISPTINIF